MEKIELDKMSWWAPKDTVLTPPDFVLSKTSTNPCPEKNCKTSSKIIFEEGFTCLNPKCKRFFEFDAEHKTLNYNQEFLGERTQYIGEPTGPISPTLPTLTEGDFGYEAKYRKGVVCPQCRCCIRRVHWRSWICENDTCDFTYSLSQSLVSVSDAILQGRDNSNSQTLPQPICHPSIRSAMTTVGLYDIIEYAIPGEGDEIAGFIRHFKSRSLINEQPDGPNELFRQMQTDVFNLKRSASRLKGSKYIASLDT